MTIDEYLQNLNTLYRTGNAREHAYRGDLANLIMSIVPDILATNEPARVACGAPDYVLTRRDVPVGYIEAKDIGVDLASKSLREQFDRYRAGLPNLIFTDYLDFHFYKDGILTTKIAIAKLENNVIVPIKDNFDQFSELIRNFSLTISQSIKSPTKLAQMMAGKAKLMADVIEKSLAHDDKEGNRSQLKSQMMSFQQMLIHDIDNKGFSDIYSQTIAYGMFAARYHDPTLPTFSRMEAAELIPRSNPFLRRLFQDIAGFELDSRLVWIVDELVNIFLASDVALIMKNFGRNTKQEDPVVHFYETFLGEYNPALRKARGVWYTPQPVVNFIVRAVDDILKTEFGLSQGLADTSKTKIKKKSVTQTGIGANSKIMEVLSEVEVHKVQILDPATGTGTFLAEVVKHVYKKFEGKQGIWSKYVTSDLIPRLNGFELLMASYAMAHLKMDMLLTETGYKPSADQRFRIFLTNSLEEAHPDTTTLFSSWLSDEADQANAIKRDSPVMVVMGNPPYAVSSTNKNDWIQNLISDYKTNLNERKINLDDDYIKFTRFGQYLVDKNGEGVLAYISNNSFIDGITHRQMRKHLLESFDKIYILNLHGNAKKKEISPDGTPDQNVFDIMQGVSINLFIKTGKKKKNELGQVFHSDLYGKRDFKYRFLESSVADVKWQNIKIETPYYFFVPKDFGLQEQYEKGLQVNKLFKLNSNGIETKCDSLAIHYNKLDLEKVIENFKSEDIDALKRIYTSKENSSGWNFESAKKSINSDIFYYEKMQYRPFDIRETVITKNSGGFIGRSRFDVMQHFLNPNIGIIVPRQTTQDYRHSFITNKIIDGNITASAKLFGTGCLFPLYIYPQNGQQTSTSSSERLPNLNTQIVSQIADSLDLIFTNEKEQTSNTFAPIDLLDYIYAILHSPNYRKKYNEFLKIDFPRVPIPSDHVTFWQLVELGGELRQIHLLQHPQLERTSTTFNIDGSDIVMKLQFKDGNVHINETQYFGNVPELAWNFYIGGYQPAQKWLKDRKDRELSYDDISHYQKIIEALKETDRLMKEIDTIDIF